MAYIDTHEGYPWFGPIVALEKHINEIKEYAYCRHEYKNKVRVKNEKISRRSGLYTTELVGMLGEFIVAQYYSRLLDQDIRVNLENYLGGDDGVDFDDINGFSVDVKTGNYVFNDLIFPDLSKFRADVAMLVVPVDGREYQSFLNQDYPVMRIAGWEYKEAFLSDHIYHPRLDNDGIERKSGTWWGYGKTQTTIPSTRKCSKCDYHANAIRPIKKPK